MLKRTPLYNSHVSLGARMVDFAGWEMPVQYTGPMPEHMAVRQAAGIFDVSHMGEIEVTGHDALALVQMVTTNDASKLDDNQVQYSVLTNETGGVIDDLLVYRINSEYFLLVVNASGIDTDYDWIKRHAASFNVELHDTSAAYALLALQGPRSEGYFKNFRIICSTRYLITGRSASGLTAYSAACRARVHGRRRIRDSL